MFWASAEEETSSATISRSRVEIINNQFKAKLKFAWLKLGKLDGRLGPSAGLSLQHRFPKHGHGWPGFSGWNHIQPDALDAL